MIWRLNEKKLLLAACGAGIGSARRQTVKMYLGGVSVFCARRSFIRRVAHVDCSSG
ncbi:hypothetical protein A2U01_0095772, partial [Trifolium medium]|nr:hypothetical protein [Trifolium medium]